MLAISSGVNDTPKSRLKSLPADDTHLKRQPMRRRNASSLGYGEIDTATSVTSRAARCGTVPS